jgi:hypothetical protein
MQFLFKNENENEGVNKLDETWITDFEKIDNSFEEYYKSDVFYVNITCIYINNSNEISSIKEEIFFLNTPNIITKEQLISLIKRNSNHINTNFSLLSLLKYNITMEPEQIKHFINSNTVLDTNYDYITKLKYIDEIVFEKTINMFHNLNNIFIIFYEKTYDKQKSNNNATKKIYLYKNLSNHKKTIRR